MVKTNGHVDLFQLQCEEIEYICKHIPLKNIREYFTKYPKDYTRIRPGFRPISLSEDETIDLLCKNVNKPFISTFIAAWLETWKNQIYEYRNGLEAKGMTSHESLLRALPHSVFNENVDLYFKLYEESLAPEYISLIKAALPLIDCYRGDDDITEQVSSEAEKMQLEAEATELKNQLLGRGEALAQLQTDFDNERVARREAAEALASVESERKNLCIELATAKTRISSLTTSLQEMQSELDHLRWLSKFSDVDTFDPHDDIHEYTSVCRVSIDYFGQPWLVRLADVASGCISRFERDDDAPRYFYNRDRLFWRDGPAVDGYVGIWHWNAVPNKNDPATDYVTAEYSNHSKIIEVEELSDCYTYDELVQYLTKNGVTPVSGVKRLFTIHITNEVMSGLLCHENDFDFNNGKCYLKQTVYTLPQFAIPSTDVLNFSDIRIYRYTSLGTPQSVYQIRTPLAVVKSIVLSRATSSILRQQGLSKKEAQHCQFFLNDLPLETIYQEIVDGYGCTDDEAHRYVDDFIAQADTYLCKTDLEVSIISEALGRNQELVAICKNQLTDEWKREHAAMMSLAHEQLTAVETEKLAIEKRVADLCHEYHLLGEKLENARSKIDAQTVLAQTVEAKVAERIAAAKKNAADFISDMAFTAGYLTTSQWNSNSNDKKVCVTRRKVETIAGASITDMDSFEEELAENLEIAGYGDQYSTDMSQMVGFSICNGMPIVVNQNAEIIADCLAAMFGKNGAFMITLPIGGACCTELCNSICRNATEHRNVFIINGIFDGFSLNAFNELLQQESAWDNKVILILALNGVSTDMLPAYVWNRAIYIDGDIGIENCCRGKLGSYTCDIILAKHFDESRLKERRKSIKSFHELVSNTALLNYSMFLAEYDETIASSLMLRLQLAVAAKPNGTSDAIADAFQKAGVNAETNSKIAKYL